LSATTTASCVRRFPLVSEPTYRVTTLGCRVNRADSLRIERELAARGYARVELGAVPDIWIVNTCAVTSEGTRKSRKAVHRCAASGARVIVTGCAVDLEPASFEVEGVDSTFPNTRKDEIVSCSCGGRVDLPGAAWAPQDLVRVPVKVQDGCARGCAYCVVPMLRPQPSSRRAVEVVAEVAELSAKGAGEVILCGIDLGSYEDPDTGAGLGSLVHKISARGGDMWLRLSSIELSDVTEAILEAMNSGTLCRHLHLPLQSGDAGVLAAMGREYSPAEFRERVLEIKESVPGISVSSDVMVGFPAESRSACENTAGLVEDLGFTRLHVFKYSRRPGTRASALGDPVPPQEKARRASKMRALAATTAARFHAGFVGRIIPVLVEDTMDSEPGRLFGRAESFAGVVFEGEESLVGTRVRIRVTSAGPEGLRGEIGAPCGRGQGDERCGR
jgi:threonylcarbamoyladenosine tRNA methylthiotransferase MtaB